MSRPTTRGSRLMGRDNVFHPDLRSTPRFVPRALVKPGTLRIMRAMESLAFDAANGVEALTLTSGRGVRLHRPPDKAGPTPALLWIHGGGYVIGMPHESDHLCRRFSRKLGITVAAPSYRLAPEHPYPAALEDLYAALKWLVS